jgi:hypothetical protein
VDRLDAAFTQFLPNRVNRLLDRVLETLEIGSPYASQQFIARYDGAVMQRQLVQNVQWLAFQVQ